MFIIMWIVLIILALIAVNTVLAVADAITPYRTDGSNTARSLIILVGISSLPFLAIMALLTAYQSF